MILYFAGSIPVKGITPEQLREMGVKHKLFSYANDKSLARKWGAKGLLLDSGAFSAWNRGIEIKMDDFIAFVEEVEPDYTIQLDVIGDDNKTWQNWKYLSDRIETIPAIHYKASKEHIERVIDAAEYITLGGLVPLSASLKKLYEWLDYIFSFPTIRDRRVHCLGIIIEKILLRYPFYSADSTSAIYPLKGNVKNFTITAKENSRQLRNVWGRKALIIYRRNIDSKVNLLQMGIDSQLNLQALATELWTKRLPECQI